MFATNAFSHAIHQADVIGPPWGGIDAVQAQENRQKDRKTGGRENIPASQLLRVIIEIYGGGSAHGRGSFFPCGTLCQAVEGMFGRMMTDQSLLMCKWPGTLQIDSVHILSKAAFSGFMSF